MWMETNIEKQDVRALSIASRVFNPVTAVHENRTVSEESENVGLEISPSSVSPLPAKEMQPDSVDVSHKVWLKWFVFERSWIVCFWFIVCLFQFLLWSVLPRNRLTKCSLQTASSLPSTSSIVMPASDSKKLAEPCRTTSVFVPPEEKADIITSTSLAEPETDATVGTPPTSEVCPLNQNRNCFDFLIWQDFLKYLLQCQTAVSSVSSEKKQPMTSTEAAELLKKSLVSIITRTEAQKLAEAIAKDPSLAKFIDIPLTKVTFYVHVTLIFNLCISKSAIIFSYLFRKLRFICTL